MCFIYLKGRIYRERDGVTERKREIFHLLFQLSKPPYMPGLGQVEASDFFQDFTWVGESQGLVMLSIVYPSILAGSMDWE